jgi:hypothetical protein
MKRPTYAALQQTVKDLRAQSATSMRIALKDIQKADDRLMASACVLHLTALGGRSIIDPVAIVDGLSAATIASIQSDIRRSMEISKFKE